jgi:hypothetical protein
MEPSLTAGRRCSFTIIILPVTFQVSGQFQQRQYDAAAVPGAGDAHLQTLGLVLHHFLAITIAMMSLISTCASKHMEVHETILSIHETILSIHELFVDSRCNNLKGKKKHNLI